MAKKDKKKSKKKDNPGTDAVGAVRTAVEKTFHATAEGAQSTRTRAQDLVDELTNASKRVREMIEQIGVLEDLKKQLDALASRVAALERNGGGTSSTPARKPAASRSTRKPATRRKATAKKPAARKRAASSSSARKPAASRSTGTTRKPAAKKSTS